MYHATLTQNGKAHVFAGPDTARAVYNLVKLWPGDRNDIRIVGPNGDPVTLDALRDAAEREGIEADAQFYRDMSG